MIITLPFAAQATDSCRAGIVGWEGKQGTVKSVQFRIIEIALPQEVQQILDVLVCGLGRHNGLVLKVT